MRIGHAAQLELSHFLAHLSATLSETLHHVFSPAVAEVGGDYAQRVNFRLYVLRNHNSYEPVSADALAQLRAALEQLRVEGQEFVFSTHQMTLADDPTLAVAFTSSIRSAVIPTLKIDGSFAAIKRLYLDSFAIRNALAVFRSQHVDGPSGGTYAAGKDGGSVKRPTAREIPIFLFSLDYPLPVFVDKYYQSRALPDMVVAVQSTQHLWESHLSCNRKAVFWNLHDPLRAIVASTAQLLSGLLPAHLTYSRAHNRTAQNWVWSVGMSPLTPLSSGLSFSRIHRDAAHRNYVVKAMLAATARVNRVVSELRATPTTVGNEIAFLMSKEPHEAEAAKQEIVRNRKLHADLEALTKYHTAIKVTLANMVDDLGALDFPSAVARIDLLERTARKFAGLARRVVDRASEFECVVAAEERPLSAAYYLVAACVCAAALLWRFLRGSHLKTKMN
jgi:hypothetical protein